jgi:hypothetical protein
MLPIPIISTETLTSCAETRQARATKTSAAIKARFSIGRIRPPAAPGLIRGPRLFAALAFEYPDGSASGRVQHDRNQLRLGVAAGTATILYCLFTNKIGRAEVVHVKPPLRKTKMRKRQYSSVNLSKKCSRTIKNRSKHQGRTQTVALESSSPLLRLLSVTESAAGSRLKLRDPMPQLSPKATPPRCLICGEQPKLIISILDTCKGRMVHMFGCKCDTKTWSSEAA